MSSKLKKASQNVINEKSQLIHSERLEPEIEEKEIEYKRQLVGVDDEKLEKRISQMKWRLCEGNGEAIYEIGIDDDGVPIGLEDDDFEESIETLSKMAKALSAELTLLHEKDVSDPHQSEEDEKRKPRKRRRVAELLVRKYGEESYIDVRITIVGHVDSGKSTLIGVLTQGVLDDGRGKARANVFVHKHEILSGRTSSVSYQILGFDSKGKIVNGNADDSFGFVEWKEIVEKSSKIITLVDLCGHERYLKTTVFGMTGSQPDYSCLIVSANDGLSKMTKEHFGLCLHLKIPVFIVVTKIDIAQPNLLKKTLQNIKKMLKLPGVKKVPYVVKTKEDVRLFQKNITGNHVCPIFLLSNVTGENMHLLKDFLNLLPVRKDWSELKKQAAEFMIDRTFYVSGIGTVVRGMVLQGSFSVGDSVHLGPDSVGRFRKIQIKGIHVKRTPVKYCSAGHIASIALRKVRRQEVRKGMVIVEDEHPTCVWEFEAEILVLYHSTIIKNNYQPVIHTLAVKQSAKIISLGEETIKTGDSRIVRFRFIYKPEYLKKGSRIVFREGRTKGMGRVTKLIPLPEKN